MLKNFTIVLVTLAVAGVAKADFTLFGTEQLTVARSHTNGTLYAQSIVRIPDEFSPWSVENLDAYHESTVYVSGGSVDDFHAWDSSTIEVSDGSIGYFETRNTSDVSISGGSVNFVSTYSTESTSVSGGSVNYLQANLNSIVNIFDGSITAITVTRYGTVNVFGGAIDTIKTSSDPTLDISGGAIDYLEINAPGLVAIHARNFFLGTGLSLSNNEIRGSGILSAQWFDGTGWVMDIKMSNHGFITIPEPATLSLLVFGGLILMKKRKALIL